MVGAYENQRIQDGLRASQIKPSNLEKIGLEKNGSSLSSTIAECAILVAGSIIGLNIGAVISYCGLQIMKYFSK